VTDKIADFGGYVDRTAGKRSSKPNLVDIFVAERGRLRRIAAGMGLTASDTEDVLQDVSIKALKGPSELENKQQCTGWLIRVTVNRCLQEYRRRRTFKRRARQILEYGRQSNAASNPGEQAIEAEEIEIVRRNLQKLDETLLAPLVLRYFSGPNSEEIAGILELPASTVRSRLREARVILARQLLKRDIEPK